MSYSICHLFSISSLIKLFISLPCRYSVLFASSLFRPSFANESALSFPASPTWLGTQAMLTSLYFILFMCRQSSVSNLGLDVDLFVFMDAATLRESVRIRNLLSDMVSFRLQI